jgi:diguanylate cyclase (GGDEF)-like protein/putative nucleotidyltransferase with HDIG domain
MILVLVSFNSWHSKDYLWFTVNLGLAVAVVALCSYYLYSGRLQKRKRLAEEIAALHLRTIEALALAIEAKDHSSRGHLRRVRIFATEIGKELGLSPTELEALKAASILHDIGKLAVPEHITSKPGPLTAEEFEKMKIHPTVGAEILQRVQFPYPVAPIVRAHHERWDGSGYPHGLAGESIPLGARILSAVDCFDALASERRYRLALSLDEAMQYVVANAGKEFDPSVVEILKRRYEELGQLAAQRAAEEMQGRSGIKTGAEAPAAGFAESGTRIVGKNLDFQASIAAARQEVQMLLELTQDLGNSLSLEDTLAVVSTRLQKLVPYDSIAIWIQDGDVLIPRHVNGKNFRLFSSLEIPLGQGLSGWVAQNAEPILNGNPSVEPGYLNDPTRFSTLRAALSVPLEGLGGVIGALTLYRAEPDSFSRDHLRILLAISSKIALSIENAVKFQQAQTSATTDYLTGLPNARSLFLHLDRELARCKRTGAALTVMVCDLDRFKHINDVYGHLEGNKVLRAFAHNLQENCREYDYVARMGGDEFVIVAPGLSPEAARHKAALISSLAMDAGRGVCNKGTLSASIGAAFFVTDGTDAEQLLAVADRRMYSAKRMHQARPGDRQQLELGLAQGLELVN